MDQKTRKITNLSLGAILLGLNLVLFNVLLGETGVRVRADLTEGSRYTMSAATKAFLRNIERPAEIIFYHTSKKAMPPVVKPLVDPLQDALSEFAIESNGKVRVRFVELDTAGKQAQEDAAEAYGVQPMRIPVVTAYEDTIKNVYFSVVVTSGGQFEQIPLAPGPLVRIVEDRATFGVKLELTDTEYVIAKALRKVLRTFNTVTGALMAKDLTADLTAFVSAPDILPEHLKGVREKVEKVVKDLEKQAPGHVKLEVVDPYEGREDPAAKRQAAEELARRYGITPLPGRAQDFYSWLLVDVGGSKEALPLYSLGGELTQADVKELVEGSVRRLVPGFLATLGVVAPSPDMPMNPMMMQRRPPDVFASTKRMLEEDYTVKDVDLSSGAVPRDVEMLLVLQPGDLGDKEVYALDQFLMRGGRIVICSGAYHMDLQAVQTTRQPLSVARSQGQKLRDWLSHNGVSVTPDLLMDTRSDYLSIPRIVTRGFDQYYTTYNVDYPFFLRIPHEALNDEHPVTAFIRSTGLFWASPVELGKLPDGVEGAVLIQTSPEASTTSSTDLVTGILDTGYHPGLGPLGRVAEVVKTVVDAVDLSTSEDTTFPPAGLRQQIDWIESVQTRQYGIGVALQGSFTSYFKDKPIPGLETDEEKKTSDGADETKNAEGTEGEEKPSPRLGAPLDSSRRPGSLVVIGDSDFLSTAPYQVFGMSEDVLRDGLKLVVNGLEWGSADELAGIRHREGAIRPLEALAGLGPEERQAEGRQATVWAFSGTFAALILFGIAWTIYRRTRRPLRLELAAPKTGDHP